MRHLKYLGLNGTKITDVGLRNLAGLTEFYRRLVLAGEVPDGTLAFLPATAGGVG